MAINPNLGMPSQYQAEEPELNLLFGISEHIPGITTGIGFQAGRSSRTIMAGGGFMDDVGFRKNRAAQKYGGFRKGQMTLAADDLKTGKQFANMGRIGARKRSLAKAGANPMIYGARVNTITARPRALGRVSSLSALSNTKGTYSYAEGVRAIGTKRFGPLGNLAKKVGAIDGENILGPGLFGAMMAGGKVNNLERLALKGNARALGKLSQVDQSITRLAGMNNPSMTTLTFGSSYNTGGYRGIPMLERMTGSGTLLSEGMAAAKSGEIGVRGNLLASSMAGKGTRYMAGYVRGATGFAGVAGLADTAAKGAQKAVTDFASSLGGGFAGKSGAMFAGEEGAQALLKGGILKEMGFKGIGESLMTKGGAKVLGARGLAMALPGVNLLATASLVYDLGKMGGAAIKGGINLARDAEKSLQGSFGKPMFGMGYRDTEAAATSRSRGVMAIQNSRLNARSALGSEAGMMAAHFG